MKGNIKFDRLKNISKGTKIWIAIVILSLVQLFYFGSKKEGYHVDEMYTYGLANSQYLPFLHFGEQEYSVADWMDEYGLGTNPAVAIKNLTKDFKDLKNHSFHVFETELYQKYLIAQNNSNDTRTTTWMDQEDYVSYLCASDTNRFNIASVYYNQRGDVHPPLYYIFLHFVCSFFPNTFSMWFGLGLNFVISLLVLYMLYKFAKEFTDRDSIALWVVAVYAFSSGFVGTALYIRMYVLLTFMVLWISKIHFTIYKKEIVKGYQKKLFIATLLGYMTHYYFVIYILVLAIVYCLIQIIHKQWRNLFIYIKTMFFAGGIGILVWPFSIKHVFGGYRGKESFTSLSNGMNIERFQILYRQMCLYLFGNRIWIIMALGVIAVLGIVCFCWKKRELTVKNKMQCFEKYLLFFIPMSIYFMEISKMAPFLADRYIMCVFPLIIFYSVIILDRTCTCLIKNEKIRTGVICFLGVLLIWNSNGLSVKPNYLFEGGQENITVPEHSKCIFVLYDGDWNESADETLILSKCEKIGIVFRSQIDVLKDGLEKNEDDTIIIASRLGMPIDEIVSEVLDIMEMDGYEEVDRQQDLGTAFVYFQKH